MMNRMVEGIGPANRTPAKRVAIAALAAWPLLSVSGCDSLLEVELPGQVPAESLENAGLANILAQSAVADFECALSNYAGATAALTDELIGATGWADYTDWDIRRILPEDDDLGSGGCTNFGFGVFTPIQTARFQAEDNFERIQAFPDAEVPDKTELLAMLAAYAGYGYVLLGEGFCEMTVDVGPIITREQVMQLAVERFTTAIELAQNVGSDDILNMARVGRARAQLNLGQEAEAAGDAELVPEGYVRWATRSAVNERRWNRIARHTHADFFYSVAPEFRGLEFGGQSDPRVQVVDAGRLGHDGRTQVWLPLKYDDVADPIAIASWEEAQLIIAEVRGGQEAVDAINRLHANAQLPAFTSANPDEIQAHILEERRRVFFLDGHRLGDLLRYELPFPSRATHKGQPYGETTCLPLPEVERNNNPSI